MKKFILILITSIVVIQVSAQNIRGKVVDNNNSPLVGANVLLLSKVDSTYIAGTTTDNNGTFFLSSQSNGDILMFSYIGYYNMYHTLKGENVGTVKMQENTQMLDAVTVTASRIVNKAQGYSIRPSGTGLENCNSSQEMFAFLPGISVSNDKIMLLDKLPVVYVNGVKIYYCPLNILS